MKNTGISLLEKWLRGTYLFLLVSIPFSLKYWTEKPFAISYLNVICLFFLGLGAVWLWQKKPIQVERSLKWVVWALFLVFIYALFFTHPLRNGVGLWVSRLILPFLVGWLSLQMLAKEVIRLEEIAGALFISLGLLLIGSVLQIVGVIPPSSFASNRLTVLYQFPNTFARYVEILLLMTFPWLLLSSSKAKISTSWTIWFLGIVMLLLTVSYNGFVSFVVSLVVIILFLPVNYKKVKQISLTAIAIILLILSLNASRLPKWQESMTSSRETRLEYWRVAEGVIKDHFWTGIGIKGWENKYQENLLKYAKPPFLNWVSPQPHNVFLDAMVKAGLPGLLAIVALLLWPIVAVVKLLKRGGLLAKEKVLSLGSANWFVLGILGYSVAMLVFGLIDDPLWSDDTMPLLFVLYLAVGWVISKLRNGNKEI